METFKKPRIKNKLLIQKIESYYLKNNLPVIKTGDSIKLNIKIKEGEKNRLQAYEGIIISKKNTNINKTITVRRIIQGIGIERSFLLNSPKIETIEIQKSSKIRRSKLYYLKNLAGKATRLKQIFKIN
jgi:large subunit ribosomal protein L19